MLSRGRIEAEPVVPGSVAQSARSKPKQHAHTRSKPAATHCHAAASVPWPTRYTAANITPELAASLRLRGLQVVVTRPCGAAGAVVGLALPAANLSGSLPASLAALQLEVLLLPDNPGAIPG